MKIRMGDRMRKPNTYYAAPMRSAPNKLRTNETIIAGSATNNLKYHNFNYGKKLSK